MQQSRIGFLGVGHMGTPMAQRLLDAGYQLTVYNHTTERAEQFARGRAQVARTPREAAERSDVLVLMLADDDAVREVVLGEVGALAAARQGAMVLDMSTVSPEANRRLAAEGRRRGVEVLDAPVSGSVPQAQQGSLVIFVGGQRDAFERCLPILQVMGQHVFHMGPSGAGNTMKLVVNTLLGVEMQAIAEALALGEKAGLERGTLLSVLGQTAVIAPSHKAKLDNAGKSVYPAAFALDMMRKDFGLILEEAMRLSVPMPATAAAAQMCDAEHAISQRAASGGGTPAEEDFSVVIRLMEELAGLQPAAR
jgi:3-hydroxyisobutyrate dehydrogenase-like beta-hydroxyacid dehydrogenase